MVAIGAIHLPSPDTIYGIAKNFSYKMLYSSVVFKSFDFSKKQGLSLADLLINATC
jgi:hypothetical protein